MKNVFENLRAAAVNALAAASVAFMLFAPVAAVAQGFNIPDGSSIQGHIRSGQQQGAPPPTAVGCTIDPAASDMIGTCTASAASGSITFNRTYTTAPKCIVWDQSATSTVSMPVYSVSATAITLTTIISTHILGYLCIGVQAST